MGNNSSFLKELYSSKRKVERELAPLIECLSKYTFLCSNFNKGDDLPRVVWGLTDMAGGFYYIYLNNGNISIYDDFGHNWESDLKGFINSLDLENMSKSGMHILLNRLSKNVISCSIFNGLANTMDIKIEYPNHLILSGSIGIDGCNILLRYSTQNLKEIHCSDYILKEKSADKTAQILDKLFGNKEGYLIYCLLTEFVSICKYIENLDINDISY